MNVTILIITAFSTFTIFTTVLAFCININSTVGCAALSLGIVFRRTSLAVPRRISSISLINLVDSPYNPNVVDKASIIVYPRNNAIKVGVSSYYYNRVGVVNNRNSLNYYII